MATIVPRVLAVADAQGVTRIRWEAVDGSPAATGDTITPWHPPGTSAIAGNFQVFGTFGGATVTVQVSNDGTNWSTMQSEGSPMTFTAAGNREFSTAAYAIRFTVSGGTGDAITAIAAFRG